MEECLQTDQGVWWSIRSLPGTLGQGLGANYMSQNMADIKIIFKQ